MSLPPRILCRAGCGDSGDPELNYLCVDCHGDRVDARRERELQRYVAAKQQAGAHDDSAGGEETSESALPPSGAALSTAPATTRRGPPSINHRRALQNFLDRPRERDAAVVSRENQFLARELAIRETSKTQLRKYMIATDEDEPVDAKEWSRYTYGTPRDVPRHDVDDATERAAQLKLFCLWRKRTLRVRVATRRQLLQDEAEREKKASKQRGLGLRGKLSLAAIASTPALAKRRETLTTALQKVVAANSSSAPRPSLLAWPSAKPKTATTVVAAQSPA